MPGKGPVKRSARVKGSMVCLNAINILVIPPLIKETKQKNSRKVTVHRFPEENDILAQLRMRLFSNIPAWRPAAAKDVMSVTSALLNWKRGSWRWKRS